MARAAIVLLLVVAIAYTSAFPEMIQNPRKCGPNEEFKACGSPCEPKCNQERPPICTFQCVIGCQCKENYVRNRDNQCVLTRDC